MHKLTQLPFGRRRSARDGMDRVVLLEAVAIPCSFEADSPAVVLVKGKLIDSACTYPFPHEQEEQS